jgi:hypothetical protein
MGAKAAPGACRGAAKFTSAPPNGPEFLKRISPPAGFACCTGIARASGACCAAAAFGAGAAAGAGGAATTCGADPNNFSASSMSSSVVFASTTPKTTTNDSNKTTKSIFMIRSIEHAQNTKRTNSESVQDSRARKNRYFLYAGEPIHQSIKPIWKYGNMEIWK